MAPSPAVEEPMTDADAHALLTAPLLEIPESEPVEPPKPRRGRPPGARNKPKPPAPPGAPPRGKPRAPRSRAGGRPDYAARITEALQVPAAILAIAGTALNSDALMADSVTVANTAGAWGQALGQIAAEKPEFASALDNMLKAGPYGLVLAVGIPFGLQIAANHKWMAPAKSMGVVDPEELLGSVRKPEPEPAAAPAPEPVWDMPAEYLPSDAL